jgi:hypothetical protein
MVPGHIAHQTQEVHSIEDSEPACEAFVLCHRARTRDDKVTGSGKGHSFHGKAQPLSLPFTPDEQGDEGGHGNAELTALSRPRFRARAEQTEIDSIGNHPYTFRHSWEATLDLL